MDGEDPSEDKKGKVGLTRLELFNGDGKEVIKRSRKRASVFLRKRIR